MITSLILALLFLAFSAKADDPLPPCYPNCGTNTYDPPQYTPPVYTNGELAARVISLIDHTLTIGVTNVNPFREYELQFSPELPATSWTTTTGKQIGNSNEIAFVVMPGDNNGFFRVADVTGDDVIAYPTYGGGTSTGTGCPGSYVGYWVYRPVANIFPFEPTGSSHSVVDPTGSTDTRIEMLGRFGDGAYCSATPLTLPGSLPDPHYSLTVYFKTVGQGTNFPLVLKGFIVRTDIP